MMMIWTVVSILSFAIPLAGNPCYFEHAGKGVINITTIGHTDGTPAFEHRLQTNVSNATGYSYSYNPCETFTASRICANIAVCQTAVEGGATYTLAYQETARWTPGSDSGEYPTVSYYANSRLVIVKLICSTNGTENFEVEGENPALTYTFRLTHKCACWNACTHTASTTTALVPTTTMPVPSACRFEHPEKGVIDFTFIGRTDEKAAYSDETTPTASNFKYSYNPCRSFSQGSDCIGVSVCQISNDGEQTLILGTQESAWWDAGSDEDSVPSVNYLYGDKKVTVQLQCSNEGNNGFRAFGEDPARTFRFQLTHKCACWNGCSKK